MREHYDFKKMTGERNPYVSSLKQAVTMQLDAATVTYFKALSDEKGISYQRLISLYLRDCALNHRELEGV